MGKRLVDTQGDTGSSPVRSTTPYKNKTGHIKWPVCFALKKRLVDTQLNPIINLLKVN